LLDDGAVAVKAVLGLEGSNAIQVEGGKCEPEKQLGDPTICWRARLIRHAAVPSVMLGQRGGSTGIAVRSRGLDDLSRGEPDAVSPADVALFPPEALDALSWSPYGDRWKN
jgi:hypothetical protein